MWIFLTDVSDYTLSNTTTGYIMDTLEKFALTVRCFYINLFNKSSSLNNYGSNPYHEIERREPNI